MYLLFVPLMDATDKEAVYVDGEPTVAESGLETLLVLLSYPT